MTAGSMLGGSAVVSEVLPQSFFDELFENAPEGIVIQDNVGRVVRANREFCRIFGYERGEVEGQSLDELIATGGLLQESVSLTDGIEGPVSMETVRRRKDGTLVDVSILARRVAAGVCPDCLIYRDITERKQAERARRESEARFRTLADTIPAAVLIHTGTRFLFTNQATEAMTGYSRDELFAKRPFDLIHPDHRALFEERWAQRNWNQSVPTRYEHKIVTRSGDPRWLDCNTTTIDFEGDRALLTIAFDVTERKRAEQARTALYDIARQADETRDLQALYASIHSIVAGLLYAENFYILLRDPETGALESPYFVDEQSSQAVPSSGDDLIEEVLRTGEPLLATPEMLQSPAAATDRKRPVAWLGVPLKDRAGAFGLLVVQSYDRDKSFDLHDQEVLTFVGRHVASAISRQRDQESLQHSEQRYHLLFESAVYGILWTSVEGRIMDANPALASILGYQSPRELVGLNLERDVYLDPWERRRILNERPRIQEARWKRRDGSIITVSMSATIARSGENHGCYEIIVEDVTERRDLEEQLRHAQKKEAIVRLAGGMAHDFNNVLTVVKGYSELLQDRFPEGDRARAQLAEICKAADRAAVLTHRLLSFSRRQVLAPRVLNLNQTLSSMEKMLRRILDDSVELKTVLDPYLGNIKVDPGQVEQVVMNLVMNARDAMPHRGQIVIQTSNLTVSEGHDAVLAPGRYIMLGVTDSGTGMDADTRSRVFEPFFTTKEHGTGLGLSTVYGIARQNGGHTAIRSEIGKGTTVKVYFPRVDDTPEACAQKPADAAGLHGTETLLLVEGEDSLRPLLREMLQQQGYKVLETGSSEEARAVCQHHPGPIHLLLIDVSLPDASGWDLSAKLLAARSEMRVLFMSGCGRDVIPNRGLVPSDIPLIEKPFTARLVTERVRKVLDGGFKWKEEE